MTANKRPKIDEAFDGIAADEAVKEWFCVSEGERSAELPELIAISGLVFVTEFFEGQHGQTDLVKLAKTAHGLINEGKITVVNMALGQQETSAARVPEALPTNTDFGEEDPVNLAVPGGCVIDALGKDGRRRIEALAGIIHATSLSEYMVNKKKHEQTMRDETLRGAAMNRQQFSDMDFVKLDNKILPKNMEDRANKLAGAILRVNYNPPFINGQRKTAGYIPSGQPYRNWLEFAKG